mmetsp:Transcript_10742/g.32881  ORF Transcript_10742/g.32881 Transcript_10742/m.32881 type:complete len:99 (+) Transcript_10742:60-356(+)|eukprot:CAMPEP_0198737382 /NCGR_PEP_ID=MMETSP1475-20131203/67828_1 /TAXON_ID= ORGANISM="Unidentified sp., Strain CCMP1999" /NCGR_SAMPLE_ID=MMETSP1475 /ASSEMBLY_ACC=CAM_ASM_001111 /LENGTH=98 /DNA_ID=CAMNT_0044501245 /DNA_START=42 /DNA_END=338 /DNA_ORIENTATION=+
MALRRGVYYTRMFDKLSEALRPQQLTIVDESDKHVGHRENSGLGETHFNIEIISSEFEGMGLVKRHRKVYEVLADELNERVHALSLVTRTLAEDDERR